MQTKTKINIKVILPSPLAVALMASQNFINSTCVANQLMVDSDNPSEKPVPVSFNEVLGKVNKLFGNSKYFISESPETVDYINSLYVGTPDSFMTFPEFAACAVRGAVIDIIRSQNFSLIPAVGYRNFIEATEAAADRYMQKEEDYFDLADEFFFSFVFGYSFPSAVIDAQTEQDMEVAEIYEKSFGKKNRKNERYVKKTENKETKNNKKAKDDILLN